MSTLSRSARSAALRSGRTLKPMMMASDADASSTSDSLIAPTPDRRILIFTLSVLSFASESASTSAEPCTSALMMSARSLLPSASCCCSDSSVTRPLFAPSALAFACSCRNTRNLPRLGRVVQRLERVAGRGHAAEAEHFHRRRRRRRLDRPAAVVDERAHLADDRAGDERVADVQRAVLHEDRRHRARGRDRSSTSSTVPDALRFGFAFSSPMSVTSRTISSSRSRFCFFFAETSTMTVVPPHASGTRPELGELALDVVGVRARLVDLVDRHDDRHVGGLARDRSPPCVCGITPSSAATTSTTTSVTFAPRARIIVNASWPGVSRKTTLRPSPTGTW